MVDTFDQERIRWNNVLNTFTQSHGVVRLARVCIYDRMDDQNELNVEFPTSLVNFTVHLAQYEQLKTGEPGKDEIIYPNDLMEAISETAARDESYCHAMAGYFNSKEHVNSDPDIVRVSEFLALNTAMTRLHGYEP